MWLDQAYLGIWGSGCIGQPRVPPSVVVCRGSGIGMWTAVGTSLKMSGSSDMLGSRACWYLRGTLTNRFPHSGRRSARERSAGQPRWTDVMQRTGAYEYTPSPNVCGASRRVKGGAASRRPCRSHSPFAVYYTYSFSWSVRRHAASAVQGVPEDRDGDSLWPVGCGLQGFSEAAGQAAAHAAAFLARRSSCPDFWPQLQGTTLLDHTLSCWKILGPRREPVASGAARSGPFTPPVGKTSLRFHVHPSTTLPNPPLRHSSSTGFATSTVAPRGVSQTLGPALPMWCIAQDTQKGGRRTCGSSLRVRDNRTVEWLTGRPPPLAPTVLGDSHAYVFVQHVGGWTATCP